MKGQARKRNVEEISSSSSEEESDETSTGSDTSSDNDSSTGDDDSSTTGDSESSSSDSSGDSDDESEAEENGEQSAPVTPPTVRAQSPKPPPRKRANVEQKADSLPPSPQSSLMASEKLTRPLVEVTENGDRVSPPASVAGTPDAPKTKKQRELSSVPSSLNMKFGGANSSRDYEIAKAHFTDDEIRKFYESSPRDVDRALKDKPEEVAKAIRNLRKRHKNNLSSRSSRQNKVSQIEELKQNAAKITQERDFLLEENKTLKLKLEEYFKMAAALPPLMSHDIFP